MRNFLILIAYLSLPIWLFGYFAFALWLSDHTHEFSRWDPRYLLLFYGSDVAELGLIEPVSGSQRYSGQGQDGNAPPYAYVSFKTMAPPEQVMGHYADKCDAIGMTPERVPPEKMVPSERDQLALECTRDGSKLGVRAKQMNGLTEVAIGGWEWD